MIIIKAVNPTGLFSFGFMPTVGLVDQGLTFINGINEDHGGSNGASKSSFINAIKEILYSRNDSKKSGSHVINNHNDWNNGYFGIIWLSDHLGNDWRIMNVRKWKGNPPDAGILAQPSTILSTGGSYEDTDIFIERWEGDRWVDERPTSEGNKTFNDTKKKIVDDIMCMTYDQFNSYVCLGQKSE